MATNECVNCRPKPTQEELDSWRAYNKEMVELEKVKPVEIKCKELKSTVITSVGILCVTLVVNRCIKTFFGSKKKGHHKNLNNDEKSL